jgi:RNA polymerase sigma-70 factor (ECF subfamily)
MFPILLAISKEQKINNLRTDFERETLPYFDLLYNFAFRLTGKRKLAYNLLEDTYIKAIRFYDKLEKATDIKFWMFRIMRNTYIDSFRKKIKTDKTKYDEIQYSFENLNKSVDFSLLKKEIFDKLTDKEISNLTASLPEDFKIVIILHDIELFTYDEISEFVDCPVSIVRSRIHRGRKMLFLTMYNYAMDKGYIKKDKSVDGSE